jgi:hypothetical protein
MINLGQLTHSVQQNCDISDAQFAGQYSLCTFLLKMREYYRWEYDLPLTAPLSKTDVGTWLAQREQQWEEIGEQALRPLPVGDRSFEPFDSTGLNAVLAPQGIVYSGGYGLFHKPQFFLGALIRTETHADVTFYVSGCEYARELTASPAMALSDTVFIRQESLRRMLWEKIEEWRWKQNTNAPLARAIACYPAAANLERTLECMTDNETHTLILHELGEAQAGHLLGPRWEAMLAALRRAKAEFLARAVRDHVADCLVTLPTLLAQDNRAALHFYFANFSGLRREIFPEAQAVYQRWCNGVGATELRNLCEHGVQRWSDVAHALLEEFARAPDGIDAHIETLFDRAAPDAASCAR